MASFAIILPCYNPHQGWKEVIGQSIGRIRKENPLHTFRIILVNDGSQKGFNKEGLESIEGLSLVELPVNKGKGYALRKGVEQSAGSDFYIYTDVDFPYTGESFQSVIDTLVGGNVNVAAGIRNENYYTNIPGMRKKVSTFLRWLIRKLLHLQITDTQCGLKGFDGKGRELFLQTTINRYLFDLEFIFLASNDSRVILKPVTVTLRQGITFSKLNMKILVKESMNFVRILGRSIAGRNKKTHPIP